MTLSETKNYLNTKSIKYSKIEKANSYIHIFTHRNWDMQSYFIVLKDKIDVENAIWVPLDDLENIYAVLTAFQPFKKYIKERIKSNDET